jgi:hypothetical protein
MFSHAPGSHASGMVKRLSSVALWFIAVGWGFNLLGLITGTPPIVGIVVGAAVAAFVGIDPLHLFWPIKAPALVAPAKDAPPATGALQTQV